MSKDYHTDFSLRCGSWTSSFFYFCKAVAGYILLPLAALALISGIGPRLGEAINSTIDFGPILMEFAKYLDRYMLYSIPLVIFAIFIGYYPKGNYARIPFKFISSVYLALMLLMFTNGGHLEVSLPGDSLGVEGLRSIDITLEIVGVMYILAIIAFVKGFLAFTEFTDHRKEYLENLAEKFNDKDDRRARKKRKEADFDEAD